MVICLERGADLHMAQLMLLPLTVSCFSKIQIGFRAVKRVCVGLLTDRISGKGNIMQSVMSTHPSIRLFPLYTVNQLISDLDFLHVHGS